MLKQGEWQSEFLCIHYSASVTRNNHILQIKINRLNHENKKHVPNIYCKPVEKRSWTQGSGICILENSFSNTWKCCFQHFCVVCQRYSLTNLCVAENFVLPSFKKDAPPGYASLQLIFFLPHVKRGPGYDLGAGPCCFG